MLSGPGSVASIATGYGPDGPGIESRWGGEIFSTCPDRPWGLPSFMCNRYRVFPGGKEQPGRDADPSSLPVLWSRKSRTIPLLPLWAIRPVQSLSACTRVHFTLPYNLMLNSDGLTVTTKYLTQLTRHRINRCRYNRVRQYIRASLIP